MSSHRGLSTVSSVQRDLWGSGHPPWGVLLFSVARSALLCNGPLPLPDLVSPGSSGGPNSRMYLVSCLKPLRGGPRRLDTEM